jgi:TolB-like protein/DNA-binding SARP family transcriptional activator
MAMNAVAMDAPSALGSGIEGQARWSLRLLGDFELSTLPSGEEVVVPGKRERVLLAFLALSPSYRQPRRKLATLLWGDATDETKLDNLRTCVWNLRRLLGDAGRRVISSEGRDIVLDATAFEVDVLTFRRLAARSGKAGMEAAASLYSGEFLDALGIESEEFESWRREEATRCRGQALDVLTRLMTQLAELEETEQAIEVGVRILRLEPLHEVTVRSLMRLYGESGRRGTAVELYRTLTDALRKELGAQPESETRAVFADISRGGEEWTRAPAIAHAMPPLHPANISLSQFTFPLGDRGPEGRKGDADSTRSESPLERHVAPVISAPRQAQTRKRGWILAGGLAAVIAILLYTQFAPSIGPKPTVGPATVVAAAPTSAIALAVLPFANLSNDPEQEFFSDGLTEEITSALSKIPDLSVVARTSAFEFKGQNRNIRTIGDQLGASHLIEGAVRRAGDRVRITVQLIQADNGVHVWNESYDRELTDVFAIQEDIATAIAGALRMPLGLAPGERLVSSRTNNPEAYNQYLRARTVYRTRAPGAVEAVITILEPVVALDTGYAPAWALLARAYGGTQSDKSERAAREAMRLDSRNAMAYAVLAGIQLRVGNFAAAEDLHKQALALDPDDPDVLDMISNRLAFFGHVKEAVRMREKLRTLEPFVPVYNYITAHIMLNNGQNHAAIAILEAAPAGNAGGGVGNRLVTLARAYAAEGRFGEAADTLLAIPELGQQSRQSIEEAARLLRSAPTKVSLPGALPAWDGELGFVYAYVGAPDRVLDHTERVAIRGLNPPAARYLWSSEVGPARRTDRFKALVRAARYVDYWRASGWPDHCRPMGADDFVCD